MRINYHFRLSNSGTMLRLAKYNLYFENKCSYTWPEEGDLRSVHLLKHGIFKFYSEVPLQKLLGETYG